MKTRAPLRMLRSSVEHGSTRKASTSEWEIDSKWTDSEGNVWYGIFLTFISHKFQALDRISKSGTIRESVVAEACPDFDSSAYPTRIDPKDETYRIFYRR